MCWFLWLSFWLAAIILRQQQQYSRIRIRFIVFITYSPSISFYCYFTVQRYGVFPTPTIAFSWHSAYHTFGIQKKTTEPLSVSIRKRYATTPDIIGKVRWAYRTKLSPYLLLKTYKCTSLSTTAPFRILKELSVGCPSKSERMA